MQPSVTRFENPALVLDDCPLLRVTLLKLVEQRHVGSAVASEPHPLPSVHQLAESGT